MRGVTPDNIKSLGLNQVFVFGSNMAGRHGAGAALTAKKMFGAINGQGLGPQGQCFAIPTKDMSMNVIPLWRIRWYIAKFIQYAIKNPTQTFLVTKIGCGLAGYSPAEIAPLFNVHAGIPDNVWLPQEFWDILNETK